MAIKIESARNEKIKSIVKLTDSSRERKRQGLFLIEGKREIGLALSGGAEVINLFFCPDYGQAKPDLAEEAIIEVSKKVFSKISWRQHPDGLIALAKIRELKLEDLKLSSAPLLVILEAVEKPGNLGAILRTADAAGVDAVIINDSATDIYNPNVIRASQGTAFTVPVIVSSISETIKFCERNKIKIYAASPDAEREYADIDYTAGSAVLLGAEDKGLSAGWLKAADEKIKITMRGKIDSLNVSVSTAVILFEAVRQRK
ncbi:MAG: RNA methyltransferase [bacterium]|nr:RNA methyltransferase [bacterium]